MSEIVISCDLDDTLAPDKVHYEDAKEDLVDLIQENSDQTVSEDKILNYLHEVDMERYHTMGVTRTRFARSCHETAVKFVGEEIAPQAWNIARSVFMTPQAYNEIGTFDGFDRFTETVKQSHHSVVLTAGVEDIQERKIEGLNIRNHFREVEIVPSGGKKDVLEQLDTEYDTVIHIGNSMRSDIEPALEAGVIPVWMNTKDWLAREDDDNPCVITTHGLAECAELLDNTFF